MPRKARNIAKPFVVCELNRTNNTLTVVADQLEKVSDARKAIKKDILDGATKRDNYVVMKLVAKFIPETSIKFVEDGETAPPTTEPKAAPKAAAKVEVPAPKRPTPVATEGNGLPIL
jgi:hypothetical protein